MRFTQILVSLVGALGLVATSTALGRISEDKLKFPKAGMSYAAARHLLLQEGLTVAPDKPGDPDPQDPRFDCPKAWGSRCQALFLYRRKDGWKDYVVVDVNRSDKRVIEVRFAYEVDGLPSIPPPEPPGIPKLKGGYLKVRRSLLALDYKPIPRAHGETQNFYFGTKDLRHISLPEIQCPVDAGPCLAYWRAPDRRVLRIQTIGEIPTAGSIYFVNWASRQDRHADEVGVRCWGDDVCLSLSR